MLHGFYSLIEEVCALPEMKDKFVSELKNYNWISKLTFLVDITTHVNDINLKLQSKISCFMSKLFKQNFKFGRINSGLWCFQFTNTSQSQVKVWIWFCCGLNELKKELNTRFNDFRAKEADNFFENPFNAHVEKSLTGIANGNNWTSKCWISLAKI